MLANAASVGVPPIGGRVAASNSADGASSVTIVRIGLIILVEAVLNGRGGGVDFRTAGTTRFFGRPTGFVPDPDVLSNFRGMGGEATEDEV